MTKKKAVTAKAPATASKPRTAVHVNLGETKQPAKALKKVTAAQPSKLVESKKPAAKVIKKIVTTTTTTISKASAKKGPKKPALPESVHNLGLRTEVANVLIKAGYSNCKQLLAATNKAILDVPGIGEKRFVHIYDTLKKFDI